MNTHDALVAIGFTGREVSEGEFWLGVALAATGMIGVIAMCYLQWRSQRIPFSGTSVHSFRQPVDHQIIDRNVSTRYEYNGQVYHSLDEMPPEVRRYFEDKDGDGLPDILT